MKTIIGTWRLLSFKLLKADGTVINPFGSKVNGLLMYMDNGYMSGIISGEGRGNVSSTVTMGIPENERINISKNFISYAGKYRIENNKIIYNIEVSFVPNLMNRDDHIVSFRLIDDNLEISSGIQVKETEKLKLLLSWEKV